MNICVQMEGCTQFSKVFAKNGGSVQCAQSEQALWETNRIWIFKKYISLGCEQLCTDGRLYTMFQSICKEWRLCTMCTVCTGPVRVPSDLDCYFFYKFRLWTFVYRWKVVHNFPKYLQRMEAVYNVHSVYRPYERPLGFIFYRKYKFRLWTFVYRWKVVHNFAQKGGCVHCAQRVQCVQTLWETPQL